ncbi:hypothetical protein BX666DRAFT_1917249 [Dichotomocladium elegans]|nr:hypothetical protein BX666DRAFT_1917249 [Dichotomocladium elegans]
MGNERHKRRRDVHRSPLSIRPHDRPAKVRSKSAENVRVAVAKQDIHQKPISSENKVETLDLSSWAPQPSSDDISEAGSDLAEAEDTFDTRLVLGVPPIYNMTDDCLYTVFSFCSNPETLCILSRVCRRWRMLTRASWLWRSLDQDWIQFLESMFFLRHIPFHYASQHLKYTRSLSITGLDIDCEKIIPLSIPRIYPFRRLTRLFLEHMYLCDAIELTRWLSNIEELRCEDTLTNDSSQNIVISSFSELARLRVLHLNFKHLCNHADRAFFMNHSRPRPGLPSSLQELKITNLYDPEELLLESDRFWDWQRTEDTLLYKYIPLKNLSRLESLVLGRCSAYTARIWRECLIPCSKQLKHLALTGWRSGGHNESPAALEKRRTHARAAGVSVESIQEDVEQAIGEFFGNMKNLRSLELEDFYCGTGITQGLSLLREKDPYIVGATLYKAYGQPVLCVSDLLNIRIAYCRIEFNR